MQESTFERFVQQLSLCRESLAPLLLYGGSSLSSRFRTQLLALRPSLPLLRPDPPPATVHLPLFLAPRLLFIRAATMTALFLHN